MQGKYYNEYSRWLDRDMEFKMTGHAGPLCLVIPCQDGRFYEWEDRGMFDLMSDWISQGLIQFVCADTIDRETWSTHGDSQWRMEQQENWIQYLTQELIPSALEKAGLPQDSKVMVMGASMGAAHAANLYFRFPERFNRLLAMSGIYNMSPYIYDGNYDFNFYQNNPMGYLKNMEEDHPFKKLYAGNQAIFCVGQGPWEEVCLHEQHELEDLLKQQQIPAKTYYWGQDTPHDWPSWEKQIRIYVPELFEEKNEQQMPAASGQSEPAAASV